MNFTYTRQALWIWSIVLGFLVFGGYINLHLPAWLWFATIGWAATVGMWAHLR